MSATMGGAGALRSARRGGEFVLQVALTLLGLLAVTFFIGRVVPIDPVLAVVGDQAPRDVYEAVRAELGLDQPLWWQFWLYVQKMAVGDFGTSLVTNRPVLDDIARVFPATLELATIATIIGVVLGVPMGIAGAVYQDRWPDQLVRVIGLVGYSVPIFWLGIMGLLVFYGILGWVAGPGRLGVFFEDIVTPITGVILIDSAIAGEWEVFWNAISHVVLPAAVLGYFSIAYIARMTRSFMLDQLSQEYVITARAKGLSEARIIWVHALKNISVQLITVIALYYARLLEGAVLTETVFAWPGLGLYITNALLSNDMPAVLGGTVVVGVVFVAINMFSDVLYRLVDPRAK